MPAEASFDIVSQFDRQELVNAVDQVQRDVGQRYDLKSTGTTLELGADSLTVTTDAEFTLKQVKDLLIEKFVRRNLDQRILDWGKIEPASKGTIRTVAKLRSGIEQELARKVVQAIKSGAPKVRTQVQGDAVRVFGKSRDDLQGAIKLVKDQEWPVPLQFTNYR